MFNKSYLLSLSLSLYTLNTYKTKHFISNRIQHTRLLFMSIQVTFADNDFSYKNEQPP